LWDLGEFDQKGTVPTKYGPFDDLIALLSVAKQNGMFMYYDAVLNHKAWADAQEPCQAIQVDWNGINQLLESVDLIDRLHDVSAERTINPWVHFLFPGRGNARSTQKWEWFHFTGVDQYVPYPLFWCVLTRIGEWES
jgi:alpha-amylase